MNLQKPEPQENNRHKKQNDQANKQNPLAQGIQAGLIRLGDITEFSQESFIHHFF
jgi:hypothetical protein